MDAAYEAERLVQFALHAGLIKGLDAVVARNALCDVLGLAEPFRGPVTEAAPETPAEILNGLLDWAAAQGLYSAETPQYRINFEARLMGLLMPRASEVCRKFRKLYAKRGPQAATNWFYRLCIQGNYIRTAEIAKNISWKTATPYGKVEITINLTKPEKDPKAIALERKAPQNGYPACLLCLENTGYAGRANFPARQNHRLVPVTLAGEQFYLQYSPYVYFNEHCIVLHETHKPMEMGRHTLEQLFDFVRQFPHYTCGSNAELPIVGGSILSHSHFQGGNYTFPMTDAKAAVPLRSKARPGVHAAILHWPVSTVRFAGRDAGEILEAGAALLEAWRGYSDEAADIAAKSADGTAHNTVTPILHHDRQLGWVLDLALRNNRTTERFPDGIFHPHREYHNIKKENIGLIEVMGLAILPQRLKAQSEAIERILTGAEPDTSGEAGSPLAVHRLWLADLKEKYGTSLSPEKARQAVRREIGLVFCQVLENAGVFKPTEEGRAAFLRFLHAAGWAPKA